MIQLINQNLVKMKKVLLFGSLSLLLFASCKKDYTCECTFTTFTPAEIAGGWEISPESTVTTSSSTVINGKKDNVKTSCESSNGNVALGSSIVTTACSIKE